MSTLALMRFLESAPDRYDRGMRWITLGRDDRMRDALAEAALGAASAGAPARVLELGCGTGAVTLRLARAGAEVTALDQNPEMLERARERLRAAGCAADLQERTAAEIDAFPRGHFDAVVASFSLSEMSASERAFVLARAREVLRPGGRLAVADEVRPRAGVARAVFAAVRLPQALVTWLVVGGVSQPIPDLGAELAEAGFRENRERRWLGGHLAVSIAECPA